MKLLIILVLIMFQTAKNAGVPRDQLENFIRGGYVPQPLQLKFHAAAREADKSDGPTEIGVGGARGPGKSHMTFAQSALDDCQRVPELKCLYLRKVGLRAREQFEDLRKAILRFFPHKYNRSSGVITFGNKSTILVGHFKNESDVDNYLGLQYDLIVLEEAPTLSSTKYQVLRDSNRTSKLNWRPRIYSSANPGGIGHVWYKNLFIIPWRSDKEIDTRFIFGTVEDNKFVNPEYVKNLEKNVGWRLRAYRYGDWDIMAGQFFSNWDYDVHVVKPFKIPYNWPTWLAMDYGFQHFTMIYQFTRGDGKVYVTNEIARRKTLPPQIAIDVRRVIGDRRPDVFLTGADTFAKREGISVSDKWEKEGFDLAVANQDRISGAAECLHRLGSEEVEPTVFIFDNCVKLIECIPTMQHNPHSPEDVLKVDIDENGLGGDDPYDAWRYGLMHVERKIEWDNSVQWVRR